MKGSPQSCWWKASEYRAALQGLSAMFAPGNRHAVVGTKDGAIQILDIAASAVLETLEAHAGAVSHLLAPTVRFPGCVALIADRQPSTAGAQAGPPASIRARLWGGR